MDYIGPEALLKASSDVKLRLVRLLVEGGTDVDVRNSNQESPLILVCASFGESEEKDKVVQFLVKKRAKVNFQDVHGRTALIHACLNNSSDAIVTTLLEARANPWIEDNTKNTAFDYCINAGNLNRVRSLITACRENKLLTKPGSFNIEMMRLEKRLEHLPEERKCSWPLMGPRNTPAADTAHRDKNAYVQPGPTASNLLTVSEEPECTTPTQERRRKRSICHFDPIDVEAITRAADADSEEVEIRAPKPVRRGSLFATSRSASEDEKISLHFSDSEGSSFDRSSISGLEKLLRLRDSASSSIDSTESMTNLAGLPPTVKVEEAWAGNRDKDSKRKTDGILKVHKEECNGPTKASQKHKPEALDCRRVNEEKGSSFNPSTRERSENIISKIDELMSVNSDQNAPITGSLQNVNISPAVTPSVSPRPRRKTLSALVPTSGMRSPSPPRKGTSSSASRRFTVSVIEQERLTPYLWDHGSVSMTPQPPVTPPYSSRSTSPNPWIRSRNTVTPLRDNMVSKHQVQATTETDNNVFSAAEHETNHTWKHEDSRSGGEDQWDWAPPGHCMTKASVNLPAISQPSVQVKHKSSLPNFEGRTASPMIIGKTSVRRTLSDNTNIERRRQEERDCGRGRSSPNCNREDIGRRHAGIHIPPDGPPLSPVCGGMERRPRSPNTLSTTKCDILVMGKDSANRGRNIRPKLSPDLPDLVLHSPRTNTLSPNNFDPFSPRQDLGFGCLEIETGTNNALRSASPHARGSGHHSPVSPCFNSSGSQSLRTSNEPLPEILRSTTGSPKPNHAAFLPSLKVTNRKPSETEEGYFSSTPSPFDNDKSRVDQPRYSFKPISPRLAARSTGKQFYLQ